MTEKWFNLYLTQHVVSGQSFYMSCANLSTLGWFLLLTQGFMLRAISGLQCCECSAVSCNETASAILHCKNLAGHRTGTATQRSKRCVFLKPRPLSHLRTNISEASLCWTIPEQDPKQKNQLQVISNLKTCWKTFPKQKKNNFWVNLNLSLLTFDATQIELLIVSYFFHLVPSFKTRNRTATVLGTPCFQPRRKDSGPLCTNESQPPKRRNKRPKDLRKFMVDQW